MTLNNSDCNSDCLSSFFILKQTQGDKDMNWFSRCAASSLDYGDGLNWLVFSYAILYTVLFVAMIVIQFAGILWRFQLL